MDTDADYIEQQCESCKEWCSPDDQEIELIDSGAWAGSWLCYDCQLGEASAV